MSRRKEKRKNVWKTNRNKEYEPDYSYSEAPLRRKTSNYGRTSLKRLRERPHSDYSYTTLDDGYNGRRHVYKPVYKRNKYNDYDGQYNTDADESYRYQIRKKYNYVFYDDEYNDDYDDDDDDMEYISYYDEDDSDDEDEKLHSECRTCHHRGKRRGSRSQHSKNLHRYNDHDYGYVDSHNNIEKSRKRIKSETDWPRYRNNMDIYDIHNILLKKEFGRSKKNTLEPNSTFNETDMYSSYGGRTHKKRMPEYNVYTTKTTNHATAFGKHVNDQSPESLISVTDYQKTADLNFNAKTKKNASFTNGSDLIYLPVVMKDKDKKIHYKSLKEYPRIQTSTETAEKPLESIIKEYRAMYSKNNNILQHEKPTGPNINVNTFMTNQKDLNVYKVSSGPSQVFQRSGAKQKDLKKIMSLINVKSDDFQVEIADTGSSIVQARNNGATSDDSIKMEFNDSVGSSTALLKTEITEQNRRSKAGPKYENKNWKTTEPIVYAAMNTSIVKQNLDPPTNKSIVDGKNSLGPDYKFTSSFVGANLNDQRSPLKSIIRQSNVLQNKSMTKKDNVGQPDTGYVSQYQGSSPSDLESGGQDNQRISLMQSVSAPKSTGRQSNVSLTSKTSTERSKSFTRQSKPHSPKRSMASKSNATKRSQSYVDREELLGIPGQNTQRKISRSSKVQQLKQQSPLLEDQVPRQSTDNSLLVEGGVQGIEEQNIPRSMARQSGVQNRVRNSVVSDKTMGRQGQSLVRQRSEVSRIQSAANEDRRMSTSRPSNIGQGGYGFGDRPRSHVSEMEKQGIQNNTLRQSSVPQKIQSVVERGKTGDVQRPSPKKSLAKQSRVAQRDQSFVDQDKTVEKEGQITRKSEARQSSAARIKKSFVDQGKEIGTEGRNTQRSVARQGNQDQTGPSLVDQGKEIGTEVRNTQRSVARQGNQDQRGPSYVDQGKEIGTEGRNTQRSIARQSSPAQKGQSFVNRQDNLGTVKPDNEKSSLRKSSVAQTVPNFDERIETLRLSTVSNIGQQRVSTVKKSSLNTKEQEGNNKILSNIKTDSLESNPQNLQQSVATKQPSKEKSKTIMKRTLIKLGSFTRKPVKNENDQESRNAAPKRDTNRSDSNMPQKSTTKQSKLNHENPIEPEPEAGSESTLHNQQASVGKPRKSSKSKISNTFKSLLKRSKKSESKQKQLSNYEEAKKNYSELTPISDESSGQFAVMGVTSDEASGQNYGDYTSFESKITLQSSIENLSHKLGGYDLTPMFYFLNFAQFFTGVTMYDKLMEVLAFIVK